MSNFVRKGVNFNVSNPHQNELFEWVERQSKRNFSGYVKAILYAQMTRELEKERKGSDNSSANKTENKRH